MAFLYPSFLWALTALAIPIAIHLFQLRRFKRIDFPNVRFLQAVSQQTRARKKVQHWLVLLARCLALACLVLAFAQPYVPATGSTDPTGKQAVSIHLDDSWSMDATNENSRLLDQARKAAQDAVLAYDATTEFQVVTTRATGRQQLLIGRDEALDAVGQVQAGPFSRPLSKVLARQREALARSEAPRKRALVFTDLQRTTTDPENWTDDPMVRTVLVPLPGSDQANLSVDSAWFETPVRRTGQPEALHVRIRNYGERALVDVPLRLSVNGKQRALASFAVEADTHVDTVLRFTSDQAGPQWGTVSISDQPVTFDDELFLAWTVAPAINVLLIGGADAVSDEAITSVFSADSAFRLTSAALHDVRPEQVKTADLILVNALTEAPSGVAQVVADRVRQGASLALFPNAEDGSLLNNLLAPLMAGSFGARDTASVKVDAIDLRQPFYRDVFSDIPANVDLPVVRTRYRLSTPAGSDALLRLQDGKPFLVMVTSGRGSVYLGAAPLAESGGTFTRHALFVTSLLRMAELSRPMGGLYHTIGRDGEAVLDIVPQGDVVPHLIGPDGVDRVPALRRAGISPALLLDNEDLPTGSHTVVLGTDTVQRIALNASRGESDLGAWTIDELKSVLQQRGLTTFEVLDAEGEGLSVSLTALDHGTKYWTWFVVLALIFLILEVALLRLLK
ncbi:MAG: BatA domain-containing protein [Flavobacteriales bacterium]|nr:MAG: BatA domain-containing protein [Flavobacteriales bacterium]